MTSFSTDIDFDDYLNDLEDRSDPLLDEEVEEVPNFDKLNRREKLYLITCIASDLCSRMADKNDNFCKPEILEILRRLRQELSTREKESLMESLVGQLRI